MNGRYRRGGCLVFPTFAATLGILLVLGGWTGESPRVVQYGVRCLLAGVVLLGVVLVARHHGWHE